MGEPPTLCKTSPFIIISDKKNDVPKLLSIINNKAADNNTGKDNTTKIAVIKIAQIVSGSLCMLIPLVLKFRMVTI